MPKEKTPAPEPQTNDLAALTAIWRSVASAPNEDADAKATCRQVLAKIRRLTSRGNCKAVHPDEPMVEIDVPLPRGVGSNSGRPQRFTIRNSKTPTEYYGHVIVPECVARQLAHMIALNREVDARRLQDGGAIVDLDNPVAARARAIQQA